MKELTIAFDLDGTLVDTAPDLVAATNHALADLGLDPVPATVLRASIGFGARHMIAAGLTATGRDRPAAEIDRLLTLFLAYYENNIAAESRPFDGCLAALDHLKDNGVRLAVCTNKRISLTQKLLDALDLTRYFGGIAGRDTFPVNKPHPDHLRGAIALAGGDAARAIMVGDTTVDIATARAAGVPVIGCSFGYSDVPISDLTPDRLIHHFDELGPAVASMLG